MKLATAQYDPSQEVLALDSSTGPSLLPQEREEKVSTSGRPSQQLFIDPSRTSSRGATFFDPNPLHLDATAPHGNSPLKEKPAASVVFLKREPIVQNRFVPLQKWEGIVLQVLEDSFFARLGDLTSSGVDEEAEFLMEEVSDADR